MLKYFFEKKGVSVYEVAKESQIPYTTLNELVNNKKDFQDCSFKTIQKLAGYFGVSVEELYQKATDTPVKIATTWEDARYKQYSFPVVCEAAAFDTYRVHPLKQNVVKKIHEAIKNDDRIEKAILFGGSTTIRCTKDSDIDIAIELKSPDAETKNEISEKIEQVCDWNADIIWLDTILPDSKLYKNIFNGVKLK